MKDADIQLVEQTLRGSEEAFSRILELHQAQVRGFLARFVRHPDAVDDLAQETFLDAYRSMASYRGEAPLRMWLLGIARNRALRWLRDRTRSRSEQVEAALAGWLVRQLEAEETGPDDRHVAALKKCIQALPERSAGVISGFYFKGLSAAEIARNEGKKEGAVWVMLTRIRQALRQCVELKMRTGEAT